MATVGLKGITLLGMSVDQYQWI